MMIIEEIHINIVKAQRSLKILERGIIYKIYKTFGHSGEFEQSLRTLYNKLIDLKSLYIIRVEAIMRLSENKNILALIDSGYFRQFLNAVTSESMFRITSLSGFKIPETSLRVISENKNTINEMNIIKKSIFEYNELISVIRQKRNKYHFNLYRIPTISVLPNVIDGAVSIETLLPVTNLLPSRSNPQLETTNRMDKKFIINQGNSKENNFSINQ